MEAHDHTTQRTRRGARVRALLTALIAVVMVLMPGHALADRSTDPAPTMVDNGLSAAAADLGLIDAQTYVSPQFGVRVTWSDAWQADPAAMETNPGQGLDRLSIVADSVRFQAFFVSAGRESAADYLERFVDFRIDQESSAEIVASEEEDGVAWVAYRYQDQGEDVYDLVEVSVVGDGDVIQVVEVIALANAFDDSFELVNSDVEVGEQNPYVVMAGWPVSTATCVDERKLGC